MAGDLEEEFGAARHFFDSMVIFDEVVPDETDEEIMPDPGPGSDSILEDDEAQKYLVFYKVFDGNTIAGTQALMLNPALPLRAQLGVEHNWMIIFEPSTLHLVNEDERIVRKTFFK